MTSRETREHKFSRVEVIRTERDSPATVSRKGGRGGRVTADAREPPTPPETVGGR